MELFAVYIGDRLGLYRAVAERGSLTSRRLAAAAGIHERYAREWLEQQTVSGILEVEDPEAGPHDRRYRLPAGHDEVLLDESSLSCMAPMAQLVVACTRPLPEVLHAFRTGGGVPFSAYGADMLEGQARSSRALFDELLVRQWLPAVPDVHGRLTSEHPARIADLACGVGLSSIAIASAYPRVHVDGIDLDEASIERARASLAESGVQDRVSFHCRDAADPDLAGRYQLVTIFEALHDLSYPVETLRSVRALLADGGRVLIGDMRVGEHFTPDPGVHERMDYGFSIVHCLPVGMVGENAAGTGGVMRPDTVRRYATAAGFSRFDVLPIESDSWRLYLLAP
jgi:2-polyprenyl-3-methyl-5-hydroxy-6-metoxy-1,4-benzoquinol methylase